MPGENIADVLKRRAAELPAPIQIAMRCRATFRSCGREWKILLANCLAHGRRQFVEVAANFPDECRYVLEMLGQLEALVPSKKEVVKRRKTS